ncbi:MAG: RNA polymerase sigma factor [Pseudomonadota bacterium]
MKDCLHSDNDGPDVRASLKGDDKAFRRLVERYENTIAEQMRRFSRNRSEIQELVQEVFVQAYFSLPSFRGEAPFVHWLRKIAVRTGYRFWKKRDGEKRRTQAVQDHHLTLLSSPSEADPTEAADALHALLELLPPKDRLVLALYYFEELSHGEIAARTGWTGALVKVRIHRAKKKLKQILVEAGLGRD